MCWVYFLWRTVTLLSDSTNSMRKCDLRGHLNACISTDLIDFMALKPRSLSFTGISTLSTWPGVAVAWSVGSVMGDGAMMMAVDLPLPLFIRILGKNCHNYSWWFIYSSQLGNLDNLFNFIFFFSLLSFYIRMLPLLLLLCPFHTGNSRFMFVYFHCSFVVLPFAPVQMATTLNISNVMFGYVFIFSTPFFGFVSIYFALARSLAWFSFSLLLLIKKKTKWRIEKSFILPFLFRE